MTLDAAFHLSVPQFLGLQSGLYTNRGPGSHERGIPPWLWEETHRRRVQALVKTLWAVRGSGVGGCELSSRSSVLRRERRKEGDSLRGSQRRRVQTSVARLDPNREHAAHRGLGTGRGAGGRAERARRGGLREGRPRGPGACRVAISPKRREERHRGVPRGAPSARCVRGAHSPEALARAVNLQQQQQQQ